MINPSGPSGQGTDVNIWFINVFLSFTHHRVFHT